MSSPFTTQFALGMDTIEERIRIALPSLEVEQRRTLLEELSRIGVEEPDDLQFVCEEDIRHLLTPIQCRKLLHTFKSNGKMSPLYCSDVTKSNKF